MKTSMLTVGILASLLFSCNKKENRVVDGKPKVRAEQPVVAANRECFSYVTAKDTITLSFIRTVNNVKGELVYDWFERDGNVGTVAGVFEGDTLRVDYTFQSEGMTSVREAVFVRKDNTLIQGFGEIVMKGDRQSFANPKALKFDGSIVLQKVNCPD